MALPSIYTPPKDDQELQKRKELASMVKSLAASSSDYSPQDLRAEGQVLAEQGAKLGVSRNQLRNLYGQYKAEGVTPAPLGGMAESSEQPEKTAGSTTLATTPTATPATTPATAPLSPPPLSSPSAVQPPQSTNRKWAEGTFKGLDALAEMQKKPLGSTLGQRRSLESEGGRAMRMARKLQRQGFGGAAEKMALAGAELKMGEPAIRTEEFRRQQDKMAQFSAQEQADADERARKILALQDRLLERANRDLDEDSGKPPLRQMPYFVNK